MWIAVYVSSRRAEAERVQALLSQEGFLVKLRGEGPYEVVVPQAEAPEAQEVLHSAG